MVSQPYQPFRFNSPKRAKNGDADGHFHKQADLSEATVSKMMKRAIRHGSFPRSKFS
jgi:hypothetical protein